MWGFLINLIYMVIASLIIALLTKPKVQNAKPENPDGAPTIADDAMIPVLFGTRDLTQNNVVWWGDTHYDPIYAKSGGK